MDILGLFDLLLASRAGAGQAVPQNRP